MIRFYFKNLHEIIREKFSIKLVVNSNYTNVKIGDRNEAFVFISENKGIVNRMTILEGKNNSFGFDFFRA